MIPRLFAIAVCVVLVCQEQECPDCKKKNKPDAKFCGGCGKTFEKKQEPPKEKKVPKGIEGVGLTAEQVNKAIDRGANFLIAQYKARKINTRESFLCALALMHAQAFDRDPAVKAGLLKTVRDAHPNDLGTYNVAVLAMVLDELGDDLPKLADCAKYFVETQGKDGTWAYGHGVPQLVKDKKARRRRITIDGGEPIDEPGKPWVELARENAVDWAGGGGDNSCTQYAMLGLRSAARRGIGIPKDVWQRCYDETVTRFQKGDGGWPYHNGGRSYGSMTCAAGATLAICRFYIDGKHAEDPWVAKACEWMGKNFTVEEHPPKHKDWIGYYLYSVERLGMIAGEEFFGDHEWYPLGAKQLVHTQGEDGSWKLNDNNEPDLSTMFALLFLTRATPKLKKDIKRGGNGTLATESVLPGEYFHLILDASGSMMKKLGGRPKSEIAVEAMGELVKSLPEHAWVGLRVYGNRKRAIEEGADTDSTLEMPIAKIDREKYMKKVRAIRFLGKTPIAYSLEQAAKDIQGLPADADVTVVLLTDGLETTPGAKPEQAAAALVARKNTKLIVIGFDLQKQELDKLQPIAEGGKGQLIAATETDLAKGLVRSIKGVGEYVVFDRDGKEVAKGAFGDRHELKEGKYSIVFQHGGKEVRRELWVNTEAVTKVVVDLYAEEK